MDASQPHFALVFGLRIAGKAITILLGSFTLTNNQAQLTPFQLFWLVLILMVLDGAIQEALSMLPSSEQTVTITNLREDRKRLQAIVPKRSERSERSEPAATRARPAQDPEPKN